MCPGISGDLKQVNDSRKTAIIDRELTRLDVSIAALQDTRLASSGYLKEENFTFFWKGKEPEDNDSRKTAIIDRELTRLDVSIAALQDTRLASSGYLKEENFTFFWKGKEPEEPRLYGVGFAVKNSLLDTVEPPTGGT